MQGRAETSHEEHGNESNEALDRLLAIQAYACKNRDSKENLGVPEALEDLLVSCQIIYSKSKYHIKFVVICWQHRLFP